MSYARRHQSQSPSSDTPSAAERYPVRTRDVLLPCRHGIARSQNFLAELRKAGIQLAGTYEFCNHHAYSTADAALLQRLRSQSGATAFVTTEKDAVNLGDYLSQLQPIHVVPVRMQFGDWPQPFAGTVDVAASPDEQLYSFLMRQNENRVRE